MPENAYAGRVAELLVWLKPFSLAQAVALREAHLRSLTLGDLPARLVVMDQRCLPREGEAAARLAATLRTALLRARARLVVDGVAPDDLPDLAGLYPLDLAVQASDAA